MDSEEKKRIVAAALGRLSREELRRLRLLVYEMLQRRRSYPAYDELTSLARERNLSAAFKTVALVACGLSGALASSSNPIQHVAPLKELIWLKEKINIQLLVSAHRLSEAVDIAAASEDACGQGRYMLAQRSLRDAAQLLKYPAA